MWSYIKQSIFPARCLICQQSSISQPVCDPCQSLLPRIQHGCLQCGLALEDPVERICGNCIKQTPFYDLTYVPFHYAPPLSQIIKQLKFQQGLEYSQLLGTLIANHIEEKVNTRPQVLLPVPLHAKRMRERGYNQALEMARPISRLLGVPIDSRLCIRNRHTQEQSHLSIKERRRNIRRAFALTAAVDYHHVAIIDDVITTGNTVNELARCLKQAGVKTVEVWCCCRA